MDSDARSNRSQGVLVGGAVAALVAATGMVSAYQGNQNTYLLHAVADLGGPLRADRVVRSPDPTPVFTAVARAALEVTGGPVGLYVLWVAAAALFFWALWWAASPLLGERRALAVWTGAMALLTAPLLGQVVSSFTDAHLGGFTAPGALLGGVAEQYALGLYLQPSVAGVLLVGAAVATVRHRSDPRWVASLFLAGVIHPTYLVTGWVVAGGVALAQAAVRTGWRDRARALATVVAVGLVASVPGALANLGPLRAARGPGAAQADEILAVHRLPHHADPGRWLEPATLVVIVVVLALLLWVRRRSEGDVRALAEAMLATALLAGMLTVPAAVLDDPSLRLLFPWRASIVVVPIAFSLAVGMVARRVPSAAVVALAVVVPLALAGVVRTADSVRHPVTEDRLVAAIRAHPPAGEGLIPVGQEDVRLNAGHPVYADFKNHPLAPAAVIAWWDRYREAAAAQGDPAALCALVERHHEGWVVAPAPVVRAARRHCLSGWDGIAVGSWVYARRPTT